MLQGFVFLMSLIEKILIFSFKISILIVYIFIKLDSYSNYIFTALSYEGTYLSSEVFFEYVLNFPLFIVLSMNTSFADLLCCCKQECHCSVLVYVTIKYS